MEIIKAQKGKEYSGSPGGYDVNLTVIPPKPKGRVRPLLLA